MGGPEDFRNERDKRVENQVKGLDREITLKWSVLSSAKELFEVWAPKYRITSQVQKQIVSAFENVVVITPTTISATELIDEFAMAVNESTVESFSEERDRVRAVKSFSDELRERLFRI